jgi:hypothetical protein
VPVAIVESFEVFSAVRAFCTKQRQTENKFNHHECLLLRNRTVLLCWSRSRRKSIANCARSYFCSRWLNQKRRKTFNEGKCCFHVSRRCAHSKWRVGTNLKKAPTIVGKWAPHRKIVCTCRYAPCVFLHHCSCRDGILGRFLGTYVHIRPTCAMSTSQARCKRLDT